MPKPPPTPLSSSARVIAYIRFSNMRYEGSLERKPSSVDPAAERTIKNLSVAGSRLDDGGLREAIAVLTALRAPRRWRR